jgi:hypothetical protein
MKNKKQLKLVILPVSQLQRLQNCSQHFAVFCIVDQCSKFGFGCRRHGQLQGGLCPSMGLDVLSVSICMPHSFQIQAKKLKECQVFGVSHNEFQNYAVDNHGEWEEKGERIVAKFVAWTARDHVTQVAMFCGGLQHATTAIAHNSPMPPNSLSKQHQNDFSSSCHPKGCCSCSGTSKSTDFRASPLWACVSDDHYQQYFQRRRSLLDQY